MQVTDARRIQRVRINAPRKTVKQRMDAACWYVIGFAILYLVAQIARAAVMDGGFKFQ